MTLGTTYNNPFNISLPAQGIVGTIVGAPGQPGYASFPDMATGYQAGITRLNQFITGQTSHGTLNTIAALGPVYAGDPAWASSVSRLSGIPLNQTLDPNNAAQMTALQNGIVTQEQGPGPASTIFSAVGGGATNNPTTPDTGNGDWVGTGSSGGDAPDMAVTNTSTSSGAAMGDQYSGMGTLGTPTLGTEANTANSSPLGVGDTAYSGNLATSAPVANNTPVSSVTSNPIQPNASAGSGASAATAPVGNDQGTPSLGGGVAGGGAPIDITNAPQVGTQAAGTIASGATSAANTVSKALGGVTSGLGSDTQSAETTGTSWLDSVFADVNNTLVRGGFIAAGIFVLLLAGLFFYLDAQKGGSNVQVVPIPF